MRAQEEEAMCDLEVWRCDELIKDSYGLLLLMPRRGKRPRCCLLVRTGAKDSRRQGCEIVHVMKLQLRHQRRALL
jgi:hypothetical protein